MFCFQCEQTASGKGCTVQGVCGKKSETSNLQDELINYVIKLAICNEINDINTALIIDGLFITVTNVNFDNNSIENFIRKVKEQIRCNVDFDINNI